MQETELLIIGAGPIGLACGISAQKAGIDYVIIEKGALVNSLFHYPLQMTFFSTSEKLEIGGLPFTSISPKPGRQEAIEYYRRVSQNLKLNLHLYEEVIRLDREEDGRFQIKTNKNSYNAQFVIVATGFYDLPNFLNVPGENLSKVKHYYKEPHPYAFQKVLIVGAQNSAVDAALETWRKGAEVTMVIRQEEIGTRVKYWVKPDIENRIKEGSIKAYFNSSILEIRPTEVDIKTPEGVITLENDFVLAMTGFQPNLKLLQSFGIQLNREEAYSPVYNPETMETNISGLFLAGVICGGMNTHIWFIENSRSHADLIINAIISKRS